MTCHDASSCIAVVAHLIRFKLVVVIIIIGLSLVLIILLLLLLVSISMNGCSRFLCSCHCLTWLCCLKEEGRREWHAKVRGGRHIEVWQRWQCEGRHAGD